MKPFYTHLHQLNFFSSKQIVALGMDSAYAKVRLHNEVKAGRIYRISRGKYITREKRNELIHQNKRHHRLSYIACNVIYPGSVISHETALARHQIIPEMVTGTVCVTLKKTKEVTTPRDIIDYRTLTKRFRGGYTSTHIDDMTYYTATAEKALFDWIWWKKDIVREDSRFQELRLEFDLLDYESFKERIEKSQSPKMQKVLLHLTHIRGS